MSKSKLSQLDIPVQRPTQQQKFIYMSKSKSVEPAQHFSSTANSTAKNSYVCQNQSPLNQLDISAQAPTQQQKYIYMLKSKSVEPARNSSSSASSTAKIHTCVIIKFL